MQAPDSSTPVEVALHRAVMDVFMRHERPLEQAFLAEEVLRQARWSAHRPTLEEVRQVLEQLVECGRLKAQPDTSAVKDLEEFYRPRRLYRLSGIPH